MNSYVQITQPPASIDLTTLKIVKEELKITSTKDDEKLRRWITECSDQIATFIDRQIAKVGVTETFSVPVWNVWNYYNIPSPTHPQSSGYGWSKPIILSITPIDSIGSIVQGGTLTDPSLYQFDAQTGEVWALDSSGYRTGWTGNPIVVGYIGGYELPGDPALPRNISRSCVGLMRHRWYGDDKDPMIRQENVPGILETIYVTTLPGDDASMPPEICGLLQAFKRINVP